MTAIPIDSDLIKIDISTQTTFDGDHFYFITVESINGPIKYNSDTEEIYFDSARLAVVAAMDHVNALIAQGILR